MFPVSFSCTFSKFEFKSLIYTYFRIAIYVGIFIILKLAAKCNYFYAPL